MADLILPSLEIQNFRAFEHLRIERLGRVNLITGKNNVGKTSLLEALYLYARGSSSSVRDFLDSRDEMKVPTGVSISSKYEDVTRQISNIRHLFYGRKKIEDIKQPIRIGPIGGEKMLFAISSNLLNDVYNFGKEAFNHATKEELAKSLSLHEKGAELFPVLYTVFRTPLNTWSLVTASDFVERNFGLQFGVSGKLNCQFIKVDDDQAVTASQLWDEIALTPQEDGVIDALRIISPDIQRVSFVGEEDGVRGRIPILRVASVSDPIPVRSLGDGINRLFNIALALTAARDGILLIDELEVGLHYSMMPDMWRYLFDIAERLNVQVFATTHSWDCIEAFERAAAEDENEEAVLIRLSQKADKLTPTIFGERELAIVTRDLIEVR